MSTLKVANVHLDASGFNRIDYLNDNRVRIHAIDRISTFVANTERVTILSSGNVGINIVNPTALLHVNGEANIRSLNISSIFAGGANVAGINVSSAISDIYTKANTLFLSNSNAFGTRYVNTAAPSGGSDGDIWYKVDS
jgi:hypothetical protein